MKDSIQAIRNDILSTEIIHCPFCGVKNVDLTAEGNPEPLGCPHLLFVATDEGWEYQSDRFIESLKLGMEDRERIEWSSPTSIIDRTTIPHAFYFYGYTGSLGGYIGYSSSID